MTNSTITPGAKVYNVAGAVALYAREELARAEAALIDAQQKVQQTEQVA